MLSPSALSALLVFPQVELDTVLSDLEAADFEELVRRGGFPQRYKVELSVISHSEHLSSGLRAFGLCFDTGHVYLPQGFLFS